MAPFAFLLFISGVHVLRRLPSFVIITSLVIACAAGDRRLPSMPLAATSKISDATAIHATIAESTVLLPLELSAVRLRRA